MNPLHAGLRIGGPVVGLLCCALLLSACGVPRAVPERADPQVYASLDICGVVPVKQLQASHPGAEVQPTISLPASCAVHLNDDRDKGGDSISVSIVDSKVPDAVRTKGGSGVTDESVAGSTVVDVAAAEEASCVSYVLSDSGIWLSISPGRAGDEERGSQICGVVTDLARSVAARLNAGVPTIDWPAQSLFRKDVCALTESSGLAGSLGIEAELQAHPTHLQCGYSASGSTPGPLNAAIVSVDIDGEWRDIPGQDVKRLTIAGHRAEVDGSLVSDEDGHGGLCTISIDFGPNPEIERRYRSDERETLRVSLMSRGRYGCESAVPAVTALVESLD